MTTSTLVPLDEYLATVYDSDREYIDGEVIERNMGELDHAGLQGIILAWLYNQRREARIHVFPELRVQIAATRYRIPDITVTTHKPQGRILREPPFLCIEILSPEDRASRMEGKIDDYLAFGIPHIWVIDPELRRAWSYTSAGKRESSDVLTTTDPGLSLVLRDVFKELDEEVAR